MANWRTTPLDIYSSLHGGGPRAEHLAELIAAGAAGKLRKKMSLRDIEGLARDAPSAAQRDDYEFVLGVVSTIALKDAGARARSVGNDSYNPQTLEVTYIALNQSLSLPGALVSFDDNYRPSFRREEVYGRMDPIATYQGTTRNIGLEWEMNIASAASPEIALAAFQDLIKFMYPVYQDTTYNQLGTGTLVAPPVLRLEITNSDVGNSGLFQGYNKGLLCIVDNFSYSRFTAGGGEVNIMQSPSGEGDFLVSPTHLTISLQLTVLHEEAKVGFVYSKENDEVVTQFGQGEDFPYGFGTTLDVSETPPSRLNALAAEVRDLEKELLKARTQDDASMNAERTALSVIL